jgi:hypothetical protein
MNDKVIGVRIVPAPPGKHGYSMAQGTKVLTQDGVEIQRVTEINLRCKAGDLWRGEISVMPSPDEINALVKVSSHKPLTWWRRALLRLAGSTVIYSTTMTSTHHEHRRLQ